MNTTPATPTTQPAALPIALKLADKAFQIPADAQKVMLTRTPSGWETQEVATIGESDLLVIRDGMGIVKAFKKEVKLYEAKKEITNFESTNWMITVPGYNRLNQIAGLHNFSPVMIYEGKEYPNPYPIMGDNGEVKKYVSRKVVIGYSPVGNLVAIDCVRYYDLEAYYMQSLQAKAKKYPGVAKLGTEFMCPFAPDAAIENKKGTDHCYCRKDNKVYLFKRIKDVEGIWVDLESEEIQSLYKEHTQHMKFGDVIAQTVCLRNAYKAHPAIATTGISVSGGIASVLVYGFKSGLSRERVAEIGNRIAKGEVVEGVSVEQSTEAIPYEELEIELNSVAEEEEGSPSPATSQPATGEKTGERIAQDVAIRNAHEQAKHTPGKSQPKKPEPKPEQKKTFTIEEQIAEEAKSKGINLKLMMKNLFGFDNDEECNVDKLNDFQKDKLLKVLRGVSGNGGAK